MSRSYRWVPAGKAVPRFVEQREQRLQILEHRAERRRVRQALAQGLLPEPAQSTLILTREWFPHTKLAACSRRSRHRVLGK